MDGIDKYFLSEKGVQLPKQRSMHIIPTVWDQVDKEALLDMPNFDDDFERELYNNLKEQGFTHE